ncbi:hypothetical protein [Pusillibacter faecalis]|nr:hypothetical protein [Pusillibacter faecalis]MCQ5025280.1 hypothetical protein [Oscillibacter valericigenes]
MLEGLILAGVALWLTLAVRSCRRHRGSCGGDCARCRRRCGP